ncbi:MAG: PEP-CTERM sorting domain-containing protein, partial [Kamptonema sp. SIO4C4]|nr:PEP-CTERM sorting domain-containing protein [Kamptonema sp. SIO4C4]
GEVIGRSGDPNVAYMSKDDASGVIEMDLIGHYNIWDAPWLDVAIYNKANEIAAGNSSLTASIESQLQGIVSAWEQDIEFLQISEIAKVTVNGQTQYAYSFSAEDTGFVDDDGSSHSGRYTISLKGTPESESVPEPSVLLGLAAFGGLFAASKRKNA